LSIKPGFSPLVYNLRLIGSSALKAVSSLLVGFYTNKPSFATPCPVKELP
jgi:hypothetical protein